jgi:cytoskeletal protein RodZ
MSTPSHSPVQADFTFYRPKPDGDIDPAGEIGWYLQRERERRGLSLEQAGEQCAIHPRHLTGIELGDLTQLPDRSDALRMIGQYAQFLGFDPQPLVLHYAQFLPQPILTRRILKGRRPRPLSSAKILSFPDISKLKGMGSGAGGIVASVFAAVLVFEGGIYMLSPSAEPGAVEKPAEHLAQVEKVETEPMPVIAIAPKKVTEEVVSSIAKVSEEPLRDTSLDKLTKEADQSAGALSGLAELISQDLTQPDAKIKVPLPKAKPKIVPQAVAGVAEEQTVPAVATAPATKVADSTGRVLGAKNGKARLVLTAKENVWVRIEDRDGNVVVTQTMRKGDSYNVPNREGLVVIARDGGLLSYAIDGKPMGTLGDKGEILVGRPLDLGALPRS